jgi:hypothetical protein
VEGFKRKSLNSLRSTGIFYPGKFKQFWQDYRSDPLAGDSKENSSIRFAQPLFFIPENSNNSGRITEVIHWWGIQKKIPQFASLNRYFLSLKIQTSLIFRDKKCRAFARDFLLSG